MNIKSVPCEFSDSCFTCPLADCIVEKANVNYIEYGSAGSQTKRFTSETLIKEEK